MEGDALRAPYGDDGSQWTTIPGAVAVPLAVQMPAQTAVAASAAAAAAAPLLQQEAEDDQITDSGRNWSPEVLLELVKIWRREHFARPELSSAQRMQVIYDAFRQTVDCSHRSRKAVDDKLYSMKQMYQFITKMNSNFRDGGAGPPKTGDSGLPSWFEITKEERRTLRSIHRVRIPNISREVFDVFDSALGSSARESHAMEDKSGFVAGPNATAAAAAGAPESGSSGRAQSAASSTATPAPSDDPPEIVDIKRNWSYDVTCQLAKVWNSVHREHPELRGATLSLQVYRAFMAAVGGSSRSRKAVDDKMHSMKEMYRFIKAYETSRLAGEPKTAWYDLTKPERRAVRAENKIRVPNLAPFVYNEIDMLMTRMNQDPNAGTSADAAGEAASAEQESSVPQRQATAACAAEAAAAPSASTPQSANGSGRQKAGENGVRKTAEVAAMEHRVATSPAVPSAAAQQGNGGLRRGRESSDASVSAPMSQSAEPSDPKRQRTTAAREGASGPWATSALVDAQTARAFMEQLRAAIAEDREERRQQHSEQMAALRDIAELLKRSR